MRSRRLWAAGTSRRTSRAVVVAGQPSTDRRRGATRARSAADVAVIGCDRASELAAPMNALRCRASSSSIDRLQRETRSETTWTGWSMRSGRCGRCAATTAGRSTATGEIIAEISAKASSTSPLPRKSRPRKLMPAPRDEQLGEPRDDEAEGEVERRQPERDAEQACRPRARTRPGRARRSRSRQRARRPRPRARRRAPACRRRASRRRAPPASRSGSSPGPRARRRPAR